MDFAQARYFNSRFGRFLCPDNFANDTNQENPQSWNLYSYVLNNPLNYIDPTGEYYVGIDGRRVKMYLDENGRIVVGWNASPDLIRLVNLANASESADLIQDIMDGHRSKTRINVDIVTGKEASGLTGIFGQTRPHDKKGPIEDINSGRRPIIKTDKKTGKKYYKEVTVLINEDTFRQKNEQYMEVFRDPYGEDITVEEAMAVTFAHEIALHATNSAEIEERQKIYPKKYAHPDPTDFEKKLFDQIEEAKKRRIIYQIK